VRERVETPAQCIRRMERILRAGKFPRISDRRRTELAARERQDWRRRLADFRADTHVASSST
jgi:hypothetical protein